MANPNPPTQHLKRTAGPGRKKGVPNRLNRERIERELRYLALFDPRQLLGRVNKGSRTFTLREIAELPDEVARCISSYDVVLGNVDKSDNSLETVIKVRWYSKPEALELCGRALGMWKDNLNLTVSDEVLNRLDAWKNKNREKP